jgi:hypothetical protein
MIEFNKDPNAKLDYTLDWTDWLVTGDTVSTSVWTVPSGLTAVSDSNTTTTTTIWLSGGTAGKFYTISNRITTLSGRIEDQSFQLRINDDSVTYTSFITLDQVKEDLRVTHENDDAILQIYLDAAVDEVKRFLNRDELPTLPVVYPFLDSDYPMDSEETPSASDPIVPSCYAAVFLLVRAKYDATDPEEVEGLRRAAESLLMPYRTNWGM